MTVDVVAQVLVSMLGLAALWSVSGRKASEKTRARGFVLGLMSQPFWFVTIMAHEQYGLLPVALAYTFVWGRGVYEHREYLKASSGEWM